MERGVATTQGVDHIGGLHEGALVMEEDVFVADGDDVVVEDAGVDGVGVLLGEDGLFVIH